MAGMPGSDFATLLDEAMADRDEEGKASLAASVDYLSVMEELHSGRINFSDEAARNEYKAFAEGTAGRADNLTRVAAPSLVPTLPSVDPSDIARELGLTEATSGRSLDSLRREFAFRNHPDRVPGELRERAALRMQIANMLIDEAKRGKRKPTRG